MKTHKPKELPINFQTIQQDVLAQTSLTLTHQFNNIVMEECMPTVLFFDERGTIIYQIGAVCKNTPIIDASMNHISDNTLSRKVRKIVYETKLKKQCLSDTISMKIGSTSSYIYITSKIIQLPNIATQNFIMIKLMNIGNCITPLQQIDQPTKPAPSSTATNEQKYRALLNAVPDSILTISKDGVCTDYIAEKGKGLIPPAAFIGNKIVDLLPSDTAEEAMEHLQRSLTTKKTIRFTFEYRVDEKLLQYETVEDTLGYYEAIFSPLTTESCLCLVREVTDHVLGEEALKKTTDYYQMLLKSSPAPMIILNRDTTPVFVNKAALVVLGLKTMDELTGKPLLDFVHKKWQKTAKNILKEGFQSGHILDKKGVISIHKADKTTCEIEIIGAMTTYHNQQVVQIMFNLLPEAAPKEFDNVVDAFDEIY